MKHIYTFSGGQDSTAMVVRSLELGSPLEQNVTDLDNKLKRLHDRFETVTLQLDNLEIIRDELISFDRCTYRVDKKIYKLEDKQYQIQLKIEELELCS